MEDISGKLFDTGIDQPPNDGEEQDGEDGREIEPNTAQPQRREETAEEREVRIDHVVQELLKRRQPARIGQTKPREQDVDEDQEQVHVVDRLDERACSGDSVRERHDVPAVGTRHADVLRGGIPTDPRLARRPAVSDGSGAGFPGVGADGLRCYAWLKNPRSTSRARSSAETSTLRGVSRKTLS